MYNRVFKMRINRVNNNLYNICSPISIVRYKDN